MRISTSAAALLLLAATAAALPAQSPQPAAQAGAPLRVYFADVEGGQATLFVPPGGESLLIDTGWPGNEGRDAQRIAELCRRVGIQKIDDVLITHYHDDHVGGVPQLVAAIPVGRFLDHGPNRELDNAPTVAGYKAYLQVLESHHIPHLTLHAGDPLPVRGLNGVVLSSDGNVIGHAVPDAGERNAACATSPDKPLEGTENDRSLGVLLRFGQARILDLGDLTWNRERPLVCPADRIGKVDLLVVSHHGFDHSSSPALLAAIAPRVAVMDNGAHKGGSPSAWQIIENSPRIEHGGGAMWQLHTAEDAGGKNVPDARIANLRGGHAGHWIEVTVRRNGAMAVTNSRTGQTAKYPQARANPAHAGE